MRAPPRELARVQRALARLIRHPEGVAAALREAEGAGAHAAALEELVRGDARLDAARRLGVYAGAYFGRIRDALAEAFAALAETLGPAGFHDLAAAYLLVHPSRHPSLRWCGDRLPGFLAAQAAAEPFRRRWPWAPDLARLEWAISEAFDAPDAPALARADLTRVAVEAFGALRLVWHPATRLLALDWPVHAVRAAAPGARAAAVPHVPQPTHICVWREAETVRFAALDRGEAALLARARSGVRFDALCAQLAAAEGDAAAPARGAALLAAWTERPLLARPAPGRPPDAQVAPSTSARATCSRFQAGSPSRRSASLARL